MKLYLAGPYAARDRLAERVVPLLQERGHTVQAGWLGGTRPITPSSLGAALGQSTETVRMYAAADFADIDACEGLVMLTAGYLSDLWGTPDALLHTGGRHVEVGYALARSKPVYVVGEPENVFERTLCQVVPDLGALLQLLDFRRHYYPDHQTPQSSPAGS